MSYVLRGRKQCEIIVLISSFVAGLVVSQRFLFRFPEEGHFQEADKAGNQVLS